MITSTKLITAPTELPIALAEMKTYLRVDASDEDALITTQIKAATKRLEELTDRKFVTQTWDIFFDAFPCKYKNDWWDGVRDTSISTLISGQRHIELPFGPVQSITSFNTYDDDDTEYTFASSNYVVDTASDQGRISLKLGGIWPSTILRPNRGIVIRGVFGFGAGYITDPVTASTIPEDIQEAIKVLVSKMYEHRGDESPKIPAEALMLVAPYRKLKV